MANIKRGVICNGEGCGDYFTEARKLDARAEQAFIYATEAKREGMDSQAVSELSFARKLAESAQEIWDHLYTHHEEEMRDLEDY